MGVPLELWDRSSRRQLLGMLVGAVFVLEPQRSLGARVECSYHCFVLA
jgi:hypothetical protein